MPLHDHFNPPLSLRRHWQGVHSAWASAIATNLNEVLPPRYFAEPTVDYGGRMEIDIAAFDEEPVAPRSVSGTATAVWAPSAPTLIQPLSIPKPDQFEVRVYNDEEGPRLVAAVELVSPANKDRPATRRAFAVKCAALLTSGVSVSVVDAVTSRRESPHIELMGLLDVANGGPPGLLAASYRVTENHAETELQVWMEPLTVGSPLPTLPLWITPDLALPLHLEASYLSACRSLRIAV